MYFILSSWNRILKLKFQNKRLSPLHWHKSLAVTLTQTSCRDPYCVNSVWIHDVAAQLEKYGTFSYTTLYSLSVMCALGEEHWHSSPLLWQSQFIAAICMWVDLTLPRTADDMSLGLDPALLNSARPQELRPTKNLLPRPNWISYLGLWHKDTAMIWRRGI